jgi:hypothetical protein
MYMDNSRPVTRQEVVDFQLPSYHHVARWTNIYGNLMVSFDRLTEALLT